MKNGVDAVAVEALKAEMAEHAKLKPKKPRMRLLIRPDISPRAIMDALAGNGESIAFVTDAGQELFTGGAMTNLGMLNRLRDCQAVLSMHRSNEDYVWGITTSASNRIIINQEGLSDQLQQRRP